MVARLPVPRTQRLANWLAGIPFRFVTRAPFTEPKRMLILQPGTLSEVLLTTPLLQVLRNAFPRAVIDWAVSDWARPALQSNWRVTQLLLLGDGPIHPRERGRWRELIERIGSQGYDTCFIPSRSRALALLAWRAGIRQRIGLHIGGGGFAHTMRVTPDDEDDWHEAALYLLLARAIGLRGDADEQFFPTDADRTRMTHWLVDEINWLGEAPLVILHPGGGDNPVSPFPDLRWPVERFALLGNHLARAHGARVLVAGGAGDRELAAAVVGLMSAPARNLAGELTLAELGALCEMSHLYVGNDTGSSHVAAAVGCPTLILYGPTDLRRSRPFVRSQQVIALPALQHAGVGGSFSWEGNLTVDEAAVAADQLLGQGG